MQSNKVQPEFKNLRDPPIQYPKGWGRETWLLNDAALCCKILTLKQGKRCSMHFHRNKSEIFFVIQGEMLFVWIDTVNGQEQTQQLVAGDSVFVPPCLPHQFCGASVVDCVFVEASTHHEDDDSYRVRGGDSQK